MRIVLPDGGRMSVPVEVARRFLMAGGGLEEIPARCPEKVPYNRRVRVLAVVHGWFPGLAAGSERMMQHLLAALPEEEFDIHILSFGVQEEPLFVDAYEYQGMQVTVGTEPPLQPDVIITHHGIAARVVPTLYEQFPHAFVVSVYHNERFDLTDIQRLGSDLNIFNTNWVKKKINQPGIVVRPPVERMRHAVDRIGNKITLVNLQKNKGVDTFRELAKRLPDLEFLGVVGTHGDQEVNDFPRNVEVHPVTQDMRDIWKKTGVVLMPSEYESYGMVAAEACLNGIPVIAHPTPGLVECLGYAGKFIHRDQIDRYARLLKLWNEDPENYRVASYTASIQGDILEEQTSRDLARFCNRIRKMVRP